MTADTMEALKELDGLLSEAANTDDLCDPTLDEPPCPECKALFERFRALVRPGGVPQPETERKYSAQEIADAVSSFKLIVGRTDDGRLVLYRGPRPLDGTNSIPARPGGVETPPAATKVTDAARYWIGTCSECNSVTRIVPDYPKHWGHTGQTILRPCGQCGEEIELTWRELAARGAVEPPAGIDIGAIQERAEKYLDSAKELEPYAGLMVRQMADADIPGLIAEVERLRSARSTPQPAPLETDARTPEWRETMGNIPTSRRDATATPPPERPQEPDETN